MAGRPCSICADAERLRLAGEMIATGATDQAVADRIGGINRMAVARHRQNHIVRPARAVVEAANKAGGAAVAVDGKMVDKPVILKAQEILAAK